MMTNLDKYIDALEGRRERLYCFLFEERTKEVDCCEYYSEGYEYGSERCKNCIKDTIKWLLEEYKGDILSDKEREYLKTVIAPYRNSITSVCKNNSTVTIYRYYLADGETKEVVFMNIPVSEEMPFKMLEDGKKYDKRVLSL